MRDDDFLKIFKPIIEKYDSNGGIEDYLLFIKDEPSKKNDILYFSNKNYDEKGIDTQIWLMEKYPELRNILISEEPAYKFIDKTPETTDKDVLKNRTKIKENLEPYLLKLFTLFIICS